MIQDYPLVVETEPKPEDMGFLKGKVESEYKARAGLGDKQELGIFLRDDSGGINGGIYGWIQGGWMYINTIWLHESRRGQDLGTKLMQAMEQEAVKRGINRLYLGTSSFQAPGFYEKLGFEPIVVLEKLFGSYTQYLLKKERIVVQPGAAHDFTVSAPPVEEDIQTLNQNLQAYNDSHTGPITPTYLAVFLRSSEGKIDGGVMGGAFQTLAQIPYVWVDEPLRRKGYGSRMLALVEQEAAKRGAEWVVTFIHGDFALPFLKKAGYEVIGQHDDYPAGHVSYYLKKRLAE